jgi:hypothetical protein
VYVFESFLFLASTKIHCSWWVKVVIKTQLAS